MPKVDDKGEPKEHEKSADRAHAPLFPPTQFYFLKEKKKKKKKKLLENISS
jgi:hypothetical protein